MRSGVVFTRSLDWYPNIDGLTWFIDDVYPQFVGEPPDISIVGRKPSASLQEKLTGAAQVKVWPDVREIQPYLHNSRVMMVPLRMTMSWRSLNRPTLSSKPLRPIQM